MYTDTDFWVFLSFIKYDKYTDKRANPHGLKTATKPALKAIPALKIEERLIKAVLVEAEASKPKDKNFVIFSESKKNPKDNNPVKYNKNIARYTLDNCVIIYNSFSSFPSLLGNIDFFQV